MKKIALGLTAAYSADAVTTTLGFLIHETNLFEVNPLVNRVFTYYWLETSMTLEQAVGVVFTGKMLIALLVPLVVFVARDYIDAVPYARHVLWSFVVLVSVVSTGNLVVLLTW